MAYNKELANRIRRQMKFMDNNIAEKKMFGGLSFLYKGKMTVGIVKDELAVRVMGNKINELLKNSFVREMDFTKRPMKEFVFVNEEGFQSEEQLMQWINLGIEHAKNKLGE